jgi:tricorn protease
MLVSPWRPFRALLLMLAATTAAHAAEVSLEVPSGPTKMLRSPTVSATQIAFAYAQNIWVVPRAGGDARRLTSFQGQASNPRFSPDGHWLAFSGEYAGNLDV